MALTSRQTKIASEPTVAQKLRAASSEHVGERLRTVRKQKGLTQAELAERAGLHAVQITRYEKGHARPNPETIKGLAEALGVSVSTLFDGPQEEVRVAFEDQELLRRFQEVEKLPSEDRDLILKILDAFLLKRRLQNIIMG